MKILTFFLILASFQYACSGGNTHKYKTLDTNDSIIVSKVLPADYQISDYVELLKNKRVALVVNQSASINSTHLVDTLLSLGVKIEKIFAPEHGFRGNLERGEEFNSQIDKQTGISIVSLFGKNKRPNEENMKDIDAVVFDIQDVGARFFTYISTMHLVMDACAEFNIPFIVLDRPNPLGMYVEGPIRTKKYQSFVAYDAIPVVHGLTIGELAGMINGENWLECGKKCNLQVIKMKNYTHSAKYSLPVKPSPNLPNDLSIALYPSLCLFEATNISVGRGTELPFQILVYPDKKFGNFSITPQSMPGIETKPLHTGVVCFGIDLRNEKLSKAFSLKYFIQFYNKAGWGEKFFANKNWFNMLVGNETVAKLIIEGKSEAEIEKSWEKELSDFKNIRKKYLLYTE